MSDPVGTRLPRWIGTIATAAMAASAIAFTPLAAGASATVIAEVPIPTAASTPQGITTGADGTIWFAESTGGTRIGQINTAGAITEFASLTGASFWITSGPGGTLWTTESSANAIGELSSAGAFMGEFPVPTPGSDPDQIALGSDGNLWFTENLGNKIGRITPAGVITEFSIPSASAGPTAIVSGPDGNLWFTEQSGNRIGRITTAGAIKEFGPVGSMPAGMAAGLDGNVWFTEFGGNQIGRITTDGVIAEFAVTTAGSAPASIATGIDGNLWFTEYNASKIGRMSPAGAMLAEFPVPTAGSGPNGITTGLDGSLWFTEPLMHQIGHLIPGTASVTTALTYTGATAGDFNDPATVSATLVDSSTTPSTPLAAQTVTFTLNGVDTCTGLTDALGAATCQLTPSEHSGSFDLIASFAGTSQLPAASVTTSFAVGAEESALAMVGPALIANGMPASLAAALTEDGTRAVAGRKVTIGLGTGAAAQTCSATTSATGAATCAISAVNQPLGAGGLAATFGGDGFYAPASAGATSLVFAFAPGGSFVVGNGSDHLGGSVTFWSSTWSASNTLSGGQASASFKGFANTLASTPPTCGGTWSSDPGNSSGPPAGPVPTYMAVVVTSSVDKSGSTESGNITGIVIVKTDPGYGPDPGATGTGTVVAVLCSA